MKHFIGLLLFLFLFEHDVRSQTATIPFKIVKDHIYIPLKDKSGTQRNFIFDTGAESTVLSIKVAKELELEKDGEIQVTGAGASKSLEYVKNQSLNITDEIPLKKVTFILTDLSKFSWNLDGIIGNDILKKFIVKIDYTNQKLVLYSKMKEIDIKDYEAIPFHFGNSTRIPQFNVVLTLQNDERIEGNILFDTGAGLTMSIGKPHATEHNLMNRVGNTLSTSGLGLNEESSHKLARIKSLRIGKYSLGSMIVEISEANSGVFSKGDFMGLMGNVISSRFDVVINYKQKKIYLKPNSSFNDPFEAPLSGFKLKEKDQGVITVRSIIKESQAYALGLRKGDKILSVNGNETSDLEIYENDLKKKGEFASITFIDQESNEKKEIRIKLEELL
ncbi:MAG: aspartyl protease family protein [Bacteroidota bacterium]